jgi:hypothetical protein
MSFCLFESFPSPLTLSETIVVATLAFGLRSRQGGCEVAGLEVDPGLTSHAPGSAKSPESVRE